MSQFLPNRKITLAFKSSPKGKKMPNLVALLEVQTLSSGVGIP